MRDAYRASGIVRMLAEVKEFLMAFSLTRTLSEFESRMHVSRVLPPPWLV